MYCTTRPRGRTRTRFYPQIGLRNINIFSICEHCLTALGIVWILYVVFFSLHLSLPRSLWHGMKVESQIPKVIYITHRWDLCDDKVPSDEIDRRLELQPTYLALTQNVRRIKEWNPNHKVICFDDAMAEQYIESKDTKFAEYFRREPVGKYKADLFRVFILFHEGGYYMDSDMEPQMSLDEVLIPETTFWSVIDFYAHNVFQSFLASTKESPILMENLKIFDEYYSQNWTMPDVAGTVFLGNALRRFTANDKLTDIQDQKVFEGEYIHLMREQIGKQRKRHWVEWMYQIQVYDNASGTYPFWARINGYESQMTWKDRPPMPQIEIPDWKEEADEFFDVGDGSLGCQGDDCNGDIED